MTYRPRQKTARLAPYLIAIKQAHESGWTWRDLLDVIEAAGLDIADKPVNLRHTYMRAMRRYEKGSLKATQLPLPGVANTGTSETEIHQGQPSSINSAGDRKEDQSRADNQSENQSASNTGTQKQHQQHNRLSMAEEARAQGIKFDDDD